MKDILSELEVVKARLKCSFVIETTDFMAKKGLVSKRLHKIARAVSLHPALRIKNDKAGIGGIWLGSTRRAYRRYISSALQAESAPDPDVAFVTYVDVPSDTLSWIEEEIRNYSHFEHVVFQQASASISSNCGPGTFGILYFLKGDKSYNLASFIDENREDEDTEEKEDLSAVLSEEQTDPMPEEKAQPAEEPEEALEFSPEEPAKEEAAPPSEEK